MILANEATARLQPVLCTVSDRPGTDAVHTPHEGSAETGLKRPRQRREEQRMEAYCLKCRTKREMQKAEQVTMKNGKPATKGVCPTCGTSMYRIGKST